MKVCSLLELVLMLASGIISFNKPQPSRPAAINSFNNGSLHYLSNDNAPYEIISCILGSAAPNCHWTIDSLSTNRDAFGTIILIEGYKFYDTVGNTSKSIIANSADTTSYLVRLL